MSDGEDRATNPHNPLLPSPRTRVSPPSTASVAHPTLALLVDNQHFVATHVALQQQLITSQHELWAISVGATRVCAEREGEMRALADQAAHIKAEARAVAVSRTEVDQVHADIQLLVGARIDL
ncbi:protein FLX-like 1 [Miscanthus floridulus]|uniref:protein FLX-like 1 n=1 Tax=Miscanthus floridulus TaxID=154761 RepID=UPI0034597B51